MSQPSHESYSGVPDRRPVAPRVVDHGYHTGPPLPPVRKRPDFREARPQDVVPEEDDPLRGWRSLGLAGIQLSFWQGQGRHNPLLAYVAARGRFAEDALGMALWIAFVLVMGYFALWPSVGWNTLMGASLLCVALVPALGFLNTITMVTMHMRRVLRGMPLEELFLTRLRPQEIVLGLAAKPIATQNLGLLLYVATYVVLMMLRGWLYPPSLPTAFWVIVSIILASAQYLLGSILLEFASGASLRANMFIRRPTTAWLRAVLDCALATLPILVLTSILIGCALAWTGPGSVIALVLMFVAMTFGGGLLSWVREYAWDPIYWSVRYHREWWVFQDERDRDGDAPERSLFTAWRPLMLRQGLGGRMRAGDRP